MRRSRLLVLVVLGFLLALAITVSLRFAPQPELPRQFDTMLPLDPDCDLQQGPCNLPRPGGGSIQFAIEPRPIRPLEPLKFAVQLAGASATEIVVDLLGVDMNMGVTRFRLRKAQDGRFLGEGQLPVCVRSRMDWRAEVWFQTGRDGVVVAPFQFSTVTPAR